MCELLYHYTTFEAALKIIASRQLRFGCFDKANDIAECKREYYTQKIPYAEIETEVKNYYYISFTQDKKKNPGYALDNMWGYYADKWNGVCLGFDKQRIVKYFKSQCPKGRYGRVSYKELFSNALFSEIEKDETVDHFVERNIRSIFYTKAMPWSHEQEFRLVNKGTYGESLGYKDALMYVIMCMPKVEEYFKSPEYDIVSKIFPPKRIYEYGYSFGNCVVENVYGESLSEIEGIDL